MPVKYKSVEENLKDIKSKKHQKEVEARYNANPEFWDNIYKKNKQYWDNVDKKNKQKIEQMKKQEQKEKKKKEKEKRKS